MVRRSGTAARATTVRRGWRRALGFAIALQGLLAAGSGLAQEQVTLAFGTDTAPSAWLITGAGVEDTPARVVTIYPGYISFSSNGTATGQFIPGASWGAFDGVWTADFSFALPRRAQDVYLDFYDLNADDRVVLELNGTIIGDATLNGTAGAGEHTFAPGESSLPYTFAQLTSDRVQDRDTFIIGDKDPRGPDNVLRLSVNNTGIGGPAGSAQALAPSSFNSTVVRLRGLVRWTEDYQIRPYPNPLGNVVEVDDDPHGWYNAVYFQNGGVINVAQGGSLTNRAGGKLVNTGVVQNSGTLTLAGQYESLPYASLQNFGQLSVAGQVEEYGAVVNTGQLTVLDGGVFYYLGQGGGDVFRNPGLVDNRGSFVLSGETGRFTGSSDAASHFLNRKSLLINGGAKMFESVNNSDGRLTISTDGFLGGNLLNTRFATTDIRLGGAFAGGLTNEGDLQVSDSGSVLSSGLSGAPMNNTGTISILNGAGLFIGNGADFYNGGGGGISIGAGSRMDISRAGGFHNQSGVLRVDGRANGDGLFANDDTVVISGIQGEGVVRLSGLAYNGGTLLVSDGGRLEIAAGGRLEGPGTINVFHSNLVYNGLISGNTVNCDQGGRLSGTGTVSGTISMGNCALGPGNSPGTLTINGVLDMYDSASVELEIGSPDDYDRLVIGGSANFFEGAQVNVSFVDGYLPDARDDFAWLSGAHITGAAGLLYNAPYEGWSRGQFTDGAGTTHLQLASDNALDLGGGLQGGIVIGAGQVAFVEPTGPYTDYQNGGLLDNSGAVHNREGSHVVNLGSLSSAPGSLANRAGAWFVNRGHFTNEVEAPIDNYGTFYNHATGVLDNQGVVTNEANARFVNLGQVTNSGGAASILNEGRFDNCGEIVSDDSIENRGQFLVAAGASVHGETDQGGSYLQSAGRTQVDGLLAAGSIWIQGGRLGGNGRLRGSLGLMQAYAAEGPTTGTLDPGDPLAAGRLELEGDASLEGILHIDIASAALHDVLAVDGTVTGIDGTLEVALLDGFRPVLGETFDYLTARDSGAFTDFAHLLLPTLDPGLAWATRYFSDGTLATYRLEVVAAEVPAPASLALFGTGLAALAARARRRRR